MGLIDRVVLWRRSDNQGSAEDYEKHGAKILVYFYACLVFFSVSAAISHLFWTLLFGVALLALAIELRYLDLMQKLVEKKGVLK